MNRTCFFFGHADTPPDVLPQLRETVEQHITVYGVTDFYVGHYGNFDRLVTAVLKDAKERHPEIHNYLLIPYHPAEQKIKTPIGFDGSFYPFEKAVPRRFAIVEANRAMIRHCDFLIVYVRHIGKSWDFLEYAKGRAGVSIVNLACCALGTDLT